MKCLLHSKQEIRTPENAHGKLAIQSLHVWSQAFVTSLVYDLLHPLHRYVLAAAAVMLAIT